VNCYYAHCQSIYGTPQEDRDVALLEAAGFEVVNPRDLRHAAAELRRQEGGGSRR
jgi:hypothetical protein